ncbi:MAG: Crp/Fnr family transcriptional regulator [Chloroflexota bacterium]
MNKKQNLIDALQAITWFQELSKEHFEKIAEISHIVEVNKDDTLFSEGDKEDYLYIVLEGRIAIEIYSPFRGRLRIYTAEPLEIVGWSSVTPVIRQRTASTRAVLDSRLIAIDAQILRKFGDDDPELGYIIMRRMANVVAGRLMVTRLQLLDLFGHPTEDQ